MDLLDRTLDRFTVGDGCWDWRGSRNGGGYGQISHAHMNRLAHRVVYEQLVGPIPEGMQLDHLCRNRACVRPAHLEPVTCRENLMRGDTQAAQKTRQTHCINGHEFNPENTYMWGSSRQCRACHRDRAARRYRNRGM